MPGRPRTTLKRIEELIQRANAYGHDLFDLMPAQYHDRRHQRGPTSAAWHAALEAAARSLVAVRELRKLVAEKVASAQERAENNETAPK
jgi:hypothetical protein